MIEQDTTYDVAAFNTSCVRLVPYRPLRLKFDTKGGFELPEKIEICNIPTPFTIKMLCAATMHEIPIDKLRGSPQHTLRPNRPKQLSGSQATANIPWVFLVRLIENVDCLKTI